MRTPSGEPSLQASFLSWTEHPFREDPLRSRAPPPGSLFPAAPPREEPEEPSGRRRLL